MVNFVSPFFSPQKNRMRKNISRYSPFKGRLGYGFLRSESFDYLFLVELFIIGLGFRAPGFQLTEICVTCSTTDLGKAMPICYIFTGRFPKHKGQDSIVFFKNIRIILYIKKCKVGIACLNLFSEAKLTIQFIITSFSFFFK